VDRHLNSWVITVPKTILWEHYEKELEAVHDRSQVMSYRLPYKCLAQPGDRCYVVWNGRVRGWMEVTEMAHKPGFVCSTTGRVFAQGWYLVRSGPFHSVGGPAMRGFQGIRRYDTLVP